MKQRPDVMEPRESTFVRTSVVIANYNQGRYLAAAVDSALAQTASTTDVVVVDDGSTDCSREVIASYANRITPLLQENGGQVSAFNAGFAASRGDVVIFLDSDDILEPHAVATGEPHFADPRVVKVHWPLSVIDDDGARTGEVIPAVELSAGELLNSLVASGPGVDVSPPTSGNAWRRAALEELFPFRDLGDRHGGDAYLHTLIPLYGSVARIGEPLSRYRIHAENSQRRQFRARIKRDLRRFERRASLLASHLTRLGIPHDQARWKAQDSGYAWLELLDRAAEEIECAVPLGQRYLLVDDQQWADPWWRSSLTPGRDALPFPASGGTYCGPPPDSTYAITELALSRSEGVRYLVIAAPCFWWLDFYRDFASHLESRTHAVLQSERVRVYDLRW